MKKQPLFKKQFATWDEWLQYVDEKHEKNNDYFKDAINNFDFIYWIRNSNSLL